MLINETLIEAYGYTDKLINGIKKYLEDLIQNKSSKDNDMLIKIIEGLEWEYQVLYYMAQNLKGDFELLKCQKLFSELGKAIEKKDLVAISDLFEYEYLPLLEKWHLNLKQEIVLRKLN